MIQSLENIHSLCSSSCAEFIKFLPIASLPLQVSGIFLKCPSPMHVLSALSLHQPINAHPDKRTRDGHDGTLSGTRAESRPRPGNRCLICLDLLPA